MKRLIPILLVYSSALADSMSDFLTRAEATHGTPGKQAAAYLVEYMPEQDRQNLNSDFLMDNLDLALKARNHFSWAKEVPKELFFNDVLPYAMLNEPRDAWRQSYFELGSRITKEAQTATEAVQLLNQNLFNEIHVHYSTERKKANQSPSESMEQGKASCTGLSIILVNACRAVGIPARIAGTPLWSNNRGNHTWVEFWDDGWHFVGADEYDPQGVDRGWFIDNAAQAREDDPRYAIYATSWKKTETHFPMVWAPDDTSVPGTNITARYVKHPPASPNRLGIRLYSDKIKRVAADGELLTEDGQVVATFRTRDENADLNDVPEVPVEPGHRYRIRIQGRQTQLFTAEPGVVTRNLHGHDFAPIPTGLTRGEVAPQIQKIYTELLSQTRDARRQELDDKSITLDDKTLRWIESTYGKAPKSGHSLWISMHGGGNAPTALNDSQWQNQAKLYRPEEGIYIAPRAPTDTWNLWHEAHIDPLLDRLIENYIALGNVDPDRIYLLGYSAGGDGVWQLAPRMADRFAAASMMAGHPNEASLLGLRNLPFAIFVGAEDNGYDRNTVALEKADQLDALHQDDPEGYVHLARIYEGLGHWMNGKDQEALPWMADFTRTPWPRRIVWHQDDITHDRYYWLKLPEGAAEKDQELKATVEKQTIRLAGDVPRGIRVRLSDQLLDLDRPLEITVNGKQVFSGKVERSAAIIRTTLSERLDPKSAASAQIALDW